MLKDITLGQYYPTESVIHRLDPRVKLVATLMYIVSLFLFHDFVGFIVVTLFLIAIIRMSHVPFSFMLKGVRAIWLLVVITAVCNLFSHRERRLISPGNLFILQIPVSAMRSILRSVWCIWLWEPR